MRKQADALKVCPIPDAGLLVMAQRPSRLLGLPETRSLIFLIKNSPDQVEGYLDYLQPTTSHSPRDTPEMNSVTERWVRSLKEKVLCMLLRSSLPVAFWWLAVDCACYILNRIPTKTALGYMSPYEVILELLLISSGFEYGGVSVMLSSRPRSGVRISTIKHILVFLLVVLNKTQDI